MKIEGLKLTKVQKEVVNRLKEGQKLAILSTDRISGDAYFWVRENERGYHRIVEKALYPQLRKLLGLHAIEESEIVTDSKLKLEDEYDVPELKRAGVNVVKSL